MKPFYKTFLLLFLNVSFLNFNSFSQQAPGIEWERCLGGTNEDMATSVIQTLDGGYAIAGYTNSNDGDVTGNHGGNDFWIVKLDSIGNIQWQKCFGGTQDDYAESILQIPDGNLIVAGYTFSNDGDVSGNHGQADFWVVKLDISGNIQWQKCFGGMYADQGYSISQTNDKGYIMAGTTESNNGNVSGNHGGYDEWIVKIDSLGNISWQKCFGGTYVDIANSIQETFDKGYIITGSSESNDGNVTTNHGLVDYWTIKTDSLGNIQWEKSLGGSNNDLSYSVIETTDSAFVIAGYTESNNGNVTGSHGNSDCWIVKLDATGNIQWQKCFGGTGYEQAYSVKQTNNSDIIISGFTTSNNGNVSGNNGSNDYWILLIDTMGSIKWQKCLAGLFIDYSADIKQTYDGGYVIVGKSESNNGQVSCNHGMEDYWIIKLLPDTITSTFNIQHSIFNIQISPNPSSGIFQITFPSSSQKTHYTLEVVNTLGQKVFTSPPAPLQRRGEFSAQLDVSFLPKGIYLLKISGSEKAFSKIIVIQ